MPDTVTAEQPAGVQLDVFAGDDHASGGDFFYRMPWRLPAAGRRLTLASGARSRHGDVKLADFGIAKATALAETTRASIRRGKYAYMSPEQVAGEPLDRASGQFGFGVMLIELLTGARPFDGPTPLDTMDNIKRAIPPTVGALDADVAEIALRCVARAPADRFESAASLRAALTSARARRRPVSIADLGDLVRRSDPPTRPKLPTRPITA